MRRDFLKEFESRLTNVHFKSVIKVKNWKPIKNVDKVYDNEMRRKYKSNEERILSRVELWIDICRVETRHDGTLLNSAGKFYTAKRFKKSDTLKKLAKFRSYSVGRAKSKSVDNLHLSFKEEEIQMEENNISQAYSTNDLLDERTSDKMISNSMSAFGTLPKRKFRFFFFKKKEFADYYNGENKKKHLKKKKQKSSSDSYEESSVPNTPVISENSLRRHVTSHARPSLFSMESLKPEISQLSINKKIESHQYDPHENKTHSLQKKTASKFHTVSAIPSVKQETLFHNTTGLKDSFRFQTERNISSSDPQVFYYPKRRQADLGEI